ncbi:hypothetical protein AOQ84DRAFT_228916 [Glonium stellatum]|uniref:Uncharacterized protein n=1 Tax=Glonium stellatum TaxID=574774 RepID=A0A8E2EPR1_9PEZI|nr:hypothetical protein AOQ84DRAFT_228916 [Glonium stellatum]
MASIVRTIGNSIQNGLYQPTNSTGTQVTLKPPETNNGYNHDSTLNAASVRVTPIRRLKSSQNTAPEPTPKLVPVRIRPIRRLKGSDTLQYNTPFRFLDLPAELRNSVYELVVQGRDRDADTKTPIRVVGGEFCIGYHQPNITRVCRQIRREALFVFYRENVFTFNFDCVMDWLHDHDFFAHWVEIIGPENARNLRTVKITSAPLHIESLAIECPQEFPCGTLRLAMGKEYFENTWDLPERRPRSLWLLETFLLNGFETGDGELIMETENVLEVIDLLWRLQRKILLCKHKYYYWGVQSDFCEYCNVYKYRRRPVAY